MKQRTKIIATLGPASQSPAMIKKLILAGVSVFRINGAHGTIESHLEMVDNVRKVALSMHSHVGILFDLPGPKLRIGKLNTKVLELNAGQCIEFNCMKSEQDDYQIPLPMKTMTDIAQKGHRIFLNDGWVEVVVKQVKDSVICCEVIQGGELRSFKGFNLPDVDLPIDSITKIDRALLKNILQRHIDYIGLSFVRSKEDITALRSLLKKYAAKSNIIAKIEKPSAVENINGIIMASDAIMIARGDLGIEMPFNKLPGIQKDILDACRKYSTPAITATQMMESMVRTSRPTRAEASDIANAIWQGTDAVMLSEETSIGKHPVAAVRAMASIALDAEKEMHKEWIPDPKLDAMDYQAQTMSYSACIIAEQLAAKAIVVPTRTGRAPKFISTIRPETMIIALTEDENVATILSLCWGVKTIVMPHTDTVDETLSVAEKTIKSSHLLRKGDHIVVACGSYGKKNDIMRLIEVRQL